MYVNSTFSSTQTDELANIQSWGLQDLVKNDMYLQVWHLADQYRRWKSNNSTSIRLVKGKGAHEPKAQTAEAYPGFLSMKHAYSVGVLLHLPGWSASPLQGYPPSSMLLVPIYTPGWRETKSSKVPCLSRQRDGWGLNPGPPDPEFKVLTPPPHTPPQTSISNEAKLIFFMPLTWWATHEWRNRTGQEIMPTAHDCQVCPSTLTCHLKGLNFPLLARVFQRNIHSVMLTSLWRCKSSLSDLSSGRESHKRKYWILGPTSVRDMKSSKKKLIP